MLNIHIQEQAFRPSSFQSPLPSINIICQQAILQTQARQTLQLEGFTIASNADITVIVNSFHGNALLTFEFQHHPDPIVMTSNRYAEYQADLLEFGVKAVNPVGNNSAMFQAIQAVAQLEPFHSTLPKST
jgi:hypothetical protein